MKFFVNLFLVLFQICFGFNYKPIKSYTKSFSSKNLDNVNVIEPFYKNKESTNCIIFFTGGSSAIIPEIYSNFFNKLAHKNIAVFTPNFRYKNMDELIETLSKEYNEVIITGHSSGCTTALNNNNKLIKKYILLDPVDARVLGGFKKKFIVKNINSVLFLNAQNSYRINYDPFGIPFIPFLNINKEKLDTKKNCKKIIIEAKNYGHCDVLNKPFSNLMHNLRLAVGNKNRTQENLDMYQIWMSDVIETFINRNYNKLKKLKKINNTIN